MFLFIKHDKKSIRNTDNNAKKNISKNICDIIRKNKWTICDHIELLDVLNTERSVIKELIDIGYDCEQREWFDFY